MSEYSRVLRFPGSSEGMVLRMDSKRAPTVLVFHLYRNSSPARGGASSPPARVSAWHFWHSWPYAACPRCACSLVNTPSQTEREAAAMVQATNRIEMANRRIGRFILYANGARVGRSRSGRLIHCQIERKHERTPDPVHRDLWQSPEFALAISAPRLHTRSGSPG